MKDLSETGAAWTPSAPVSVSDQIRALDKAGLPRAEIARRLGKRYQHVRNVLEGDKVGRAPGVGLPSQASTGRPAPAVFPASPPVFRIEVGPDGTLTLPEPVRAALKAAECGVLIGRLDGSDLTLTDAWTSADRARERVRRLDKGTGSAVDSLIADRRREAASEGDD